MTTIRAGHISNFFERWAPSSTKQDYDNIGLLTGSTEKAINGILTCLDITEGVIEEAIDLNCDLIVAHHPLIFRKLSRINPDSFPGGLLYKLITNDIAVLAVHTNLDAARDGVSFVLADKLGLINTGFLSQEETGPVEHGLGVKGELKESMDHTSFLAHVKKSLQCDSIRYSGTCKAVKNVAVCGGSGAFLANQAIESGCDAFITADVKYHDFFTEKENFLLLDAGHYESESPVIDVMRDALKAEFASLNVKSTSINTNPILTYT